MDTKITSPVYNDYSDIDKSESLFEKLTMYLYYWPYFIVCVCICLGGAFFYLRSSVPVYTVRAKLLIKSEKNEITRGKGESSSNNSETVIENEIEILKSRSLMQQVVKNLQLWVQYSRVGKLKSEDLYGISPVSFTLIHPAKSFTGQSFEIFIKDEHTFILKQPKSKSFILFAKELKSAFGIWKLDPTENLDSYIGSTIQVTLSHPSNVADGLRGSIDAYLSNDQASIVDLAIKENVPQRGVDVLNNLIAVYNKAAIEDKNTVTASTLRFIDERLSTVSSELNGFEKKVESYKSSRGLTDISADSKVFLENVKDNDGRLNELNVQFQVFDQIQRYVKSNRGTGSAPATIGISDPNLVSLVNKLISLQLEKDKLLATTPELNPVFIPLNKQIASVKRTILENIGSIKRSLSGTRNQLEGFNSKLEASIKQVPGQEREFISIKRQQSIKEELYIYLLQKREEAVVNHASKLNGSRIIEEAYYGAPVTRNTTYTYALSFILGLLIPGGIIFGKDLLNNRITSAKEIENLIHIPILGELVQEKKATPLIVLDGSRNIIAEQFRILRTNLNYTEGKRKDGNVTLLTSGMPGEGKSFVTRNLGAAYAAAGRRSVILELDFRNPSISKYYNLQGEKGISSYLNGEALIEEIIQPSRIHPDLYVISTGYIPKNPSELLEKPEIDVLFDWLSSNFDEILIDTPPVKLVADAMILSRFSNAVLYIMRQSYTYKSDLNYLKQLYQRHKFNNLHVVLNGVSLTGKYGYKGNYNYGYYTKNIHS
ncbi:MAG: hypothetical protein JWN56_304 [Sphingobacteriales bacterium]|nr:hypothetical protein [Sphingobacteriales bacterium]